MNLFTTMPLIFRDEVFAKKSGLSLSYFSVWLFILVSSARRSRPNPWRTESRAQQPAACEPYAAGETYLDCIFEPPILQYFHCAAKKYTIVGPMLATFIASLSRRSVMSRKKIQLFLHDWFGFDLSTTCCAGWYYIERLVRLGTYFLSTKIFKMNFKAPIRSQPPFASTCCGKGGLGSNTKIDCI